MTSLDGNSLTFDQAIKIANGSGVLLSLNAKEKVDQAFQFVQKVSKGKKPVYGINTGFGALANKKINQAQLKNLQVNLLRSHAAGFGNYLTIPETRLAMVLRLNVLLKGMTGVSWELCKALNELINKEIYPLIPEQGSVGASGDLAPLAHLALPLIGEGEVIYKKKRMPAIEALKQAKQKPYQLKEKEGLSLVNGTQIMLSLGCLSLDKGLSLLRLSDLAAALSYEALLGHTDPLHPAIHQARNQKGQIESATAILNALKGSQLFDNIKRNRVQDPYSLRCAPQVHGASRDTLHYCEEILQRELNAATDNPLVFVEEDKIVSGGNFHGQCLALALDSASMACAELGNISERRLDLLLNPQMSGLNPFLTPKPGIHSGYMAIQYLCASLVNENKLLANPACTDSIPGNAGIEDFVSMGMTSAKKFKTLVVNLRTILAIELIAAAQAIDLRKIKKLGKGTRELYLKIRSVIPTLKEDRVISEDVRKVVEIL